jgi:hypothetical protein
MSIDGEKLSRDDMLADLRDALKEVDAAEQKVIRIVTAAREVGVTWQQICDAAGLSSRQAAYERYAAAVGAERAGTVTG